MACCPFHNDRTPSMKVDSRYYCFGCGASGDVIDFAASLHGLGKRDAAVRLAEDFSIPYDGAIRTPAAKRTPPKPTPEHRLRQAEQHASKCYVTICIYWNAGKSNMLHSHRMPPGILFSWKHCKKTAM